MEGIKYRLESKTFYRLFVKIYFLLLFFFSISSATTENLETSLRSTGGFSKVSKLTRDFILWEKFSKPSPLDPFLITLCFLLIFLSSNNSKYSFGFAAFQNILLDLLHLLRYWDYQYVLFQNNLIFFVFALS